MADPTARDLLDRLATLESRLNDQGAELSRYRRVNRCRRVSRHLLPVALVALLVALVPLATLAANPFTDLNPGSPHNGNIDAIYAAGITRGCDPPTYVNYCPSERVTREEMASFLARTAGLGGNPPVANALTAQSAVSAQTATNAAQLGGVLAASYVQTNSRLLPIAFATIDPYGMKLSGTANVTVAKIATGAYYVTISGVSYTYTGYATVATLVGGTAGQITTGQGTGNTLGINTSNASGTPTDRYFSFVVYQP